MTALHRALKLRAARLVVAKTEDEEWTAVDAVGVSVLQLTETLNEKELLTGEEANEIIEPLQEFVEQTGFEE